MTIIDAQPIDYQQLNDRIRATEGDITIENCLGHRFIAAAKRYGTVTINGTPGNALGAYLDGARIIVNGSAQDATGDTMNTGEIVVHGNIGDAAGYAMRGGVIYVRDNAGYRAGIHMKAYKDKLPVMVIGGRTGDFLGEYQAGGLIIVLGLQDDGPIVGNFVGTGMHGGKIFLRTGKLDIDLPKQVRSAPATAEDLKEIEEYVTNYCMHFSADAEMIMSSRFTVLTPNSANPYKQLYVEN